MFMEPVEIWTNWPEPHQYGSGHLVVGADHLPELVMTDILCQYNLPTGMIRPATLPHTWYLTTLLGHEAGVLLWAWRTIQEAQTRIAEAEQDADDNDALERERDRQDADDMIGTRIDQELDEEDTCT